VTGDAMAHALTTGELPEVARPFAPGRFTSAVAAPVLQEQPV
ncbi:glycine oxidase ThiO, partial [Streptomyces sp. SID8455]|nr:glycine oxidase ThiO [Streptomyces sp. SID8455]